jgi:hypothetical protein
LAEQSLKDTIVAMSTEIDAMVESWPRLSLVGSNSPPYQSLAEKRRIVTGVRRLSINMIPTPCTMSKSSLEP